MYLFAMLFLQAIWFQEGELIVGYTRMSLGRVVNQENGQHDPNDSQQT